MVGDERATYEIETGNYQVFGRLVSKPASRSDRSSVANTQTKQRTDKSPDTFENNRSMPEVGSKP